MAADRLELKQGDTLRWACVWTTADGAPVSLAGYEIRCEIRTSADVVAATPDVAIGGSTGAFTVVLANTSALAVDAYRVDFRVRQPDGDSYATQTFRLAITPRNTPRW